MDKFKIDYTVFNNYLDRYESKDVWELSREDVLVNTNSSTNSIIEFYTDIDTNKTSLFFIYKGVFYRLYIPDTLKHILYDRNVNTEMYLNDSDTDDYISVTGSCEDNTCQYDLYLNLESFIEWYGDVSDAIEYSKELTEDSPYRIKLIETIKMIGQNLIDNAEDYIPKNTKHLSEVIIGEIDISMNDTLPLISIRTNYVPGNEQLIKIIEDDINRRKGEQLKED